MHVSIFAGAWKSSSSHQISLDVGWSYGHNPLTKACTFSFQVRQEDKREYSDVSLSELYERVLKTEGSAGTSELRVWPVAEIPMSLL